MPFLLGDHEVNGHDCAIHIESSLQCSRSAAYSGSNGSMESAKTNRREEGLGGYLLSDSSALVRDELQLLLPVANSFRVRSAESCFKSLKPLGLVQELSCVLG